MNYVCLIRIYAKCMFPNARETKLKVLYEFNICFDVKCPECKANYKENMASSSATKKGMDELISQYAPSFSKALSNFSACIIVSHVSST